MAMDQLAWMGEVLAAARPPSNDMRVVMSEVRAVDLLAWKFGEFWDLVSLMEADRDLFALLCRQRKLFLDALSSLDIAEIQSTGRALRQSWRQAIEVMEKQVAERLKAV